MDTVETSVNVAVRPKQTQAGKPNSDKVVEDAPSSFSRVPVPENEAPAPNAATAGPLAPKRQDKKAVGKPGDKSKSDLDPIDPAEIAKANLAAAPIVGVVGYGPGDGGTSGIKRHTPSCDFCKRTSPLSPKC